MRTTPNTYNLQKGTVLLYTITNKEFTLEKVTDKNVSWYVGFEYKGGNGKNRLRMATQSLKTTNEGIEKGTYKIIK